MATISKQMEPGIERTVHQHFSGEQEHVEESEASERKNEENWLVNVKRDSKRGKVLQACAC